MIAGALFLLSLLGYVAVNHGQHARFDYFTLLADAFLHGRLGLDGAPPWLNELVPTADGRFAVVYPPAPAVLLLPLVAVFGRGLHQEIPSMLIGAANVALLSLVLREMGVPPRRRILLALVFAFGSVAWYSAVVGTAWHFAHVVATCGMLLAVYAAQRDAPTWSIGLAFGLAALSRLPVAAAAPFFAAYLADRAARSRRGSRVPFGVPRAMRAADWRPPVRVFAHLALPFVAALAVPVALDLAYNAARFGSPLEPGYALIPGLLNEAQYRNGFFSLSNIPRQLHALFLTGPAFSSNPPWIRPHLVGGLSVLLTTPLLLWSFRVRDRDWFTLGAWASVALIFVPILTHADPGGAQWGYRYAQDAYPLLFLLVARALRAGAGRAARLAAVAGFVVNAWGVLAFYYGWWA